VPEGLDLDALRRDLGALPGVAGVHDLHVWSVTSGEHNLTAHLVADTPGEDLLARVHAVAAGYGIEHTTVQIEPPGAHAQTGGHLHP
jgi:cobalt-zinc-cadmium efflux system protein